MDTLPQNKKNKTNNSHWIKAGHKTKKTLTLILGEKYSVENYNIRKPKETEGKA